jgi:hypothetical protein
VAAASDEGRMLLTLDRGIGDLRRYPPGSHSGIVVLRPAMQDPDTILALVERLVRSTHSETFTGASLLSSHNGSGSGGPKRKTPPDLADRFGHTTCIRTPPAITAMGYLGDGRCRRGDVPAAMSCGGERWAGVEGRRLNSFVGLRVVGGGDRVA